MRILKIFFGNKELDKTFIDGQSTFVLSSDEGERYGGIFQNIFCRLIKTIKHKGENWYLLETDQDFTGIDFGIGTVRVNKFIIRIRRRSNFEKNKKNDVIVYLPSDINNPLSSIKSLPEMKVIDWAYIYDIK